MARCERCNVNLSFGHLGHYCAKCTAPNAIKTSVASGQQRSVDAETKARINAILLTTETAPNLNITKRIEIVTAECAFGMNIFKDLFAGVRDIVGGRSEAVQKTMRDSRKTALYELKLEADRVGANAVVGVDLDYVELSAAGSMVMLVASGTAVIIEEKLD
jgi:uncharacterized protein YbjQ (UPF0145 family)